MINPDKKLNIEQMRFIHCELKKDLRIHILKHYGMSLNELRKEYQETRNIWVKLFYLYIEQVLAPKEYERFSRKRIRINKLFNNEVKENERKEENQHILL